MSEINESELLYDKKIKQEVFKEILDALTFIEPEFISREEYESLNWNILVETKAKNTQENKKSIDRKDYKLFLPENITNNDKIEIYNFLENKFSKDLWFITWERKIKAKIFYAVQDILNKENNENIGNNLEGNQDYKQIEKLYKKIFWEENIPNISEIKDFLSSLTQKERLEFRRDYINLARKSKKWEDISEILDSEIDFHFEELFFRHWVNNLRFGLKIMTQWEQALLEEKKWEKIRKKETLQEEEKLLREEIDIEKYKQELEEVRNTWNKEEISKKELEAANAIIKSLYVNFSYQQTKEDYWYQPSKIQQTKQLYCIWFSIVWHTFLEELWIKHKWINIHKHSALEVNIWTKKYLMDITSYPFVLEFKYWEKKWSMVKISPIWWEEQDKNWNIIETYFQSWNIEKILFWQIYNNKWGTYFIKTEIKKAIELYNKALKINPNDLFVYMNKSFTLLFSWKIKLYILYRYIIDLLKWNNIYLIEILYRKEKKQIQTFIKNKNFEWLRDYLLKLEKE